MTISGVIAPRGLEPRGSNLGSTVSYDALPVDAAHAEVFDLEEFLDAVF
jgi:hypothetical protein